MKKITKIGYLLEAIAVIIGTIIGAGVFVLPFVAEHSGFIFFFFWAIIVGIIITYLHLLFGEVVLRTKREFRLPGYTGYYLGQTAKRFILLTTFLTFSCSLLIYLILGGDFLGVILTNFLPQTEISSGLLVILLWLIFSLLIVNKNREVSRVNFYLSLFLLFIFFIIAFLAYPHINLSQINWSHPAEKWGWLLPYGVSFFALNGMVAIPEAIKVLKKRNSVSSTKKVIIIGTLVPLICYLIFVFSVVGVSGAATSRNAISGLVNILGRSIVLLGALLGFAAVSTSYLIFANYIKNSFIYDFNWTPFISYLVVVLGPMILYFSNFSNIIKLMSFLGGMLGGLESLMLVLIALKAKEHSDCQPHYQVPLSYHLAVILIISFLTGALCQTFLVY